MRNAAPIGLASRAVRICQAALNILVLLLFVLLAFAKLWIDRNRERWVTSEMMTDIYNYDLYSREVAREAIERYNRHVERCNRVTARAGAR